MHDQIGLFFAYLNVLLAIGTLILVVHGIGQFKVGLLARAEKRALPVVIFLSLFFIVEALVASDILPAITSIDDVLGTLFMICVLYMAYAFVRDWTNLEVKP